MGLSACAFVLAMELLAQTAKTWPQYGGPTGDFKATPGPSVTTAPEGWKRPIGQGVSGVVWDGETLFTHQAIIGDNKKSAREFAIAIDPASGKTLWESDPVPVTMLQGQQRFGSAPMRPQSTPALGDSALFTIGFTGVLQALDKKNGKLLWQTDLVKDHGATPVQFGFAASPILLDGKLLVASGGKHALIALNPATGKPVWTADPAPPGYSTPVPMTVAGKKIIAVLTRDSVLGVDPENGISLLRYELPKKNLTNVPTPIQVGDDQLLVSGQGLDGTRLLRLTREPSGFAVKEIWHQPKAQFFYSNWVQDGDTVWGFPGNAGKRFSGIRLADGVVVGQTAGQTDANLIGLDRDLLLIRGDGLLSLGKCGPDGFRAISATRVSQERCWVPPLPLGRSVVIRTETELMRIPLDSLKKDFKAPADSGVTAVEEAFSPPKKK